MQKVPLIQPPPPNSDGLATKEAESYAQGTLEEDARHRDHKRREEVKDLFKSVFIYGIILFFCISVAIASCWVWHLLTPESWHFLTDAQVNKLQLILISGILGNLPTFAKKYLDN